MSDDLKVIVEATGLRAPEAEKFVARVHLGAGPEGMRFAYGATPDEARYALSARMRQERADVKGEGGDNE